MAAKTTEPLLVAIAAMFTPTFAFAHTGVGEASGFLPGLATDFGARSYPGDGDGELLRMARGLSVLVRAGGLRGTHGNWRRVGRCRRRAPCRRSWSSTFECSAWRHCRAWHQAAARRGDEHRRIFRDLPWLCPWSGYVGRRRRPRLCGGLRGRNGFTRGCRDLPLLSNRGKTGEHYSSLVVRAAGGLTAVAGIGVPATRL